MLIPQAGEMSRQQKACDGSVKRSERRPPVRAVKPTFDTVTRLECCMRVSFQVVCHTLTAAPQVPHDQRVPSSIKSSLSWRRPTKLAGDRSSSDPLQV